MAGRYAHAKQFKRHHRELRFLRSRLGRIIRDLGRKIEGQPALEEAFAAALSRASQIGSASAAGQGYRGHNAANPRRMFISGQKHGVFGVIKRELSRRSAIEGAIGHMKSDGHLGRCYLKGRAGDAANVILTTVGYNLRLVLAWLRAFLRVIPHALIRALATHHRSNQLVNERRITSNWRRPHLSIKIIPY